jgi:hypothetical protein
MRPVIGRPAAVSSGAFLAQTPLSGGRRGVGATGRARRRASCRLALALAGGRNRVYSTYHNIPNIP